MCVVCECLDMREWLGLALTPLEVRLQFGGDGLSGGGQRHVGRVRAGERSWGVEDADVGEGEGNESKG